MLVEYHSRRALHRYLSLGSRMWLTDRLRQQLHQVWTEFEQEFQVLNDVVQFLEWNAEYDFLRLDLDETAEIRNNPTCS